MLFASFLVRLISFSLHYFLLTMVTSKVYDMEFVIPP